VDEAYTAGVTALEVVRGTEQHLINARFMGQQDMWGKRYLRSGQFKHEEIDKARQLAYQSKQTLIHFGNEVKDVFKDHDFQFNMEIEEFGRFTDVFFDNIITDYLVQQKITSSLTNVSGTCSRVESIMHHLQEQRSAIKDELVRLEEERRKVVVSS
jgi:hypothetical protein